MKQLVLLVWAFPVATFALTGNQAVQYMLDRSGEPNIYLNSYIRGYLDQETAVFINARAARAGGGAYVRPFCAPTDDALQAASVVAKELKQAPERNHEDLSIITRRALIRAWPCTDEQLRSP